MSLIIDRPAEDTLEGWTRQLELAIKNNLEPDRIRYFREKVALRADPVPIDASDEAFDRFLVWRRTSDDPRWSVFIAETGDA